MIGQAARRVRIKLPTAKVILSKYRKTGKILIKKLKEPALQE